MYERHRIQFHKTTSTVRTTKQYHYHKMEQIEKGILSGTEHMN